MIQLDKGAVGQVIHEQLKQLEEQVGFGIEPDIEERDEQDFEDLKKANNDTNVEVLAKNEKNLSLQELGKLQVHLEDYVQKSQLKVAKLSVNTINKPCNQSN